MEQEPKIIRAPFSSQQVADLNFYQQSGVFHEFTCGTQGVHPGIQKALIATEEGWKCTDTSCDYRQDWAHAFMADRPFVENQIRSIHELVNPSRKTLASSQEITP